jgi:hypothetical protein
LVPTSTIEISPDGRGGWQVIAAYPAKRVCSTRPGHKRLAAFEGIDAGVSEVFTDTNGRRYGTGQYQRIAKRAERDRARGKARNKLRAVRNRHLARATAATEAGDAVTACEATRKARRIDRHNLGRTKLTRQRAHDRAVTKDAVYQSVHDLVDTTAHIVAEDLSGLRGKSKFGRTTSRGYAAWQRSFFGRRAGVGAKPQRFCGDIDQPGLHITTSTPVRTPRGSAREERLLSDCGLSAAGDRV